MTNFIEIFKKLNKELLDDNGNLIENEYIQFKKEDPNILQNTNDIKLKNTLNKSNVDISNEIRNKTLSFIEHIKDQLVSDDNNLSEEEIGIYEKLYNDIKNAVPTNTYISLYLSEDRYDDGNIEDTMRHDNYYN